MHQAAEVDATKTFQRRPDGGEVTGGSAGAGPQRERDNMCNAGDFQAAGRNRERARARQSEMGK